MSREQAIEAGARAIHARYCIANGDCTGPDPQNHRDAAAVLDAIGWREPIGYGVTLSHPDDGTWLSDNIHLTAKRAAGAAGWRRGLTPAVVALIPVEDPR